MPDVTAILKAAEQGDLQAAKQLLPVVYDELRRIAASKLRAEHPGHTLQATALVHEAYIRLVGDAQFTSRGHFFAAAAEAMRRILVENARQKQRIRHGGRRQRVALDDVAGTDKNQELLELDDALTMLAEEDLAAAEVAKLHVFVGMSVEETADALKVSRATAYRHWAYAKAWLRCRMAETLENPPTL